MKYMWLLDQEAQSLFTFYQHPGQENLGDYPSKHPSADIHQHVRPYYVHMDKFSIIFTTSSTAQNLPRVCWNTRRWIPW